MKKTVVPIQHVDPLKPGYPLNQHLVAGLTVIERGGPNDFTIERPSGMKGYSLMLTTKGGGVVRDRDSSFECQRGDLMLYATQVAYHYGRAPAQARWLHRWVYFQPRGFWTPWLAWPGSPAGVGRIRVRDEARIQVLDRLFQDIDVTRVNGRRTAEDLAVNLLERLLILCHEENPAFQPEPIDERVVAACAWIDKHLDQDLTAAKIAAQVFLSPSRLAHLFKSAKNMSISNWVVGQRIALAKQLLSGSSVPISKVASQVGYADQLYFSRVFSKQVGVSPSDYRRSCLDTKLPWD